MYLLCTYNENDLFFSLPIGEQSVARKITISGQMANAPNIKSLNVTFGYITIKRASMGAKVFFLSCLFFVKNPFVLWKFE